MTAKEIAEKSGNPLWKVYHIAKQLGRLPTVEEVSTWKNKNSGRPRKHFK